MVRWLEALRAHAVADEIEARSKARIVAHVEAGGDLFDRQRWDGHLTASCFILDHERANLLLLFHKKLDKWLQPGGHGEAGEVDPLEVARREAREESGLSDLSLEPPTPFDLDVHLIPARKDEPAHEHLDIRFLFVAAPGAALRPGEGESSRLRWVPLGEVAAVSDESVARAARKLLSGRGG